MLQFVDFHFICHFMRDDTRILLLRGYTASPAIEHREVSAADSVAAPGIVVNYPCQRVYAIR